MPTFTFREPAQKVLDFVSVPGSQGLSRNRLLLANHDLLPVEKGRRKWSARSFVFFWVSDSFNINTWMISSSMIQAGMSWWQAWLAVIVGYTIVSWFVIANGRPGAVWHVGFPVQIRSSFGIWGALWPVLNRAAMACIWYGVQSWIGGQCMTLVLRSIWPSFNRLPNTMPISSGTNTRDFVGFFLFWLVSLPAIWFPVHQIRHFFMVKTIVVPVAAVAFFAWSIADAHGVGPIVKQPATIKGNELAWQFVSSVMSCISNFATLATNAPDFTRFATRPKDMVASQLISIPVTFSLTTFVGIIVSSSATTIYGENIWSPLELLGRKLDDDPYNSKARCGVFFISTAFVLAQIGVNIAANSISAGSDLTALLPRFVNIRRGGYIAAIVGLCMCPWNLVASSNSFTSYLSSYSVFLSSVIGVMVTDYYVIRRGHLDVPSLYTTSRNSTYFFFAGINLRAYVAYISGIAINIVGFAGAVGRTVPLTAQRMYTLSFFLGFGVSAIVYWALNMVWPQEGMRREGWWEDKAYEPDQDIAVLPEHGGRGAVRTAEKGEESDLEKQTANLGIKEGDADVSLKEGKVEETSSSEVKVVDVEAERE